MSSIAERVKKVIEGHLGVMPEKIVPEAHIMDDLGADSLDKVEVLMGMEEEFDIEIPDKHGEEIETVQQVNDYITKRLED